MKKRKTALLAFSLLTLTGIGITTLASCGGSNEITTRTVAIQGAKNGKVGDKIQLSALVFGVNDNSVTWESSDVAIASVDADGLVTLLSAGSVEITATSVADSTIKSSPAHITVISESDEFRLEIASLPTKTKYKFGEKVSYDGIQVMSYAYVDGTKDVTSAEIINADELTFSIPKDTTFTEADEGTKPVTVSKDGYKSTSFEITIGENIVSKKLYVSRLPSTTTYTLRSSATSAEKTATFSTRGLQVQELTYVDGKLESKRNAPSSSYTLSIMDGGKLTTEGTHEVTITSNENGVEPTSFNILVYTEDTSVFDIFKTLQTTKNYTAEVFNNVGTTTDSNGFHYLRKYNENYYDEIEYKNKRNGTEVVFDTTQPKSHIGYTTYEKDNESGIVQYSYNYRGEIQGDIIVSTGHDSWWDKGSTIARLFTLFDLNDVPTQTLNGRFLTTVIDTVEGDNDMGEQTAAKYPFVASFLDYCGWSSSLITIMNRFTVSFNNDGNLELRADFGSYGYTSLVISDIGRTTVDEVEMAIQDPAALYPADISVKAPIKTIADTFKNNNYTRFEYGENGIETNNPYAYYNNDYFYSVIDKVGYGKVTIDGKTSVQQFNGGTGSTFVAQGDPVELPAGVEFVDYVNAIMQGGQSQVRGYLASVMSNTFGDETNPDGLMYTFSEYSGLSTDTMVTYQSFDDNALQDLVDYIGGGETNEFRFWLMTTYKEYVDDSSYEDPSNIDTIEVWDINAVTLSGYVMAFGDFGETSVDWIEEGLRGVSATQALALK